MAGREANELAARTFEERISDHDNRVGALLHEVRGATGLGGRQRRTGSTDERARVAVQKAIASSLDLIHQHDPSLARLLRDTVHTGATCRYQPDPARPVTWLLDRQGEDGSR